MDEPLLELLILPILMGVGRFSGLQTKEQILQRL